jgi:hypothetical protein
VRNLRRSVTVEEELDGAVVLKRQHMSDDVALGSHGGECARA